MSYERDASMSSTAPAGSIPFVLPAVTPVIHVADLAQARANVAVAEAAGADGVWLISHRGDNEGLLDIAATVGSEHPELWIGVNSLGLRMGEAVAEIARHRVGERIGGYWSDDAGIVDAECDDAEADAGLRKSSGWDGLYVGGVAFKYQRQPRDLAATAQLATRFCDVVCTSGPGTGHAAEVEKLRELRAALGDHPLAIASGVTCENVGDHLGLIDLFLVATGISSDFHTLDPVLTGNLVSAVHQHRSSGRSV